MGIALTIGAADKEVARVTTVSGTGTIGNDKIVLGPTTRWIAVQCNNADVIMRFSTATDHGFTIPQTNVATVSNGPTLMPMSGSVTLYFTAGSGDKIEVLEFS